MFGKTVWKKIEMEELLWFSVIPLWRWLSKKSSFGKKEWDGMNIKVLSRNIPFHSLITEKNIHYIHEMEVKSQFLNSILILRNDKYKRQSYSYKKKKKNLYYYFKFHLFLYKLVNTIQKIHHIHFHFIALFYPLLIALLYKLPNIMWRKEIEASYYIYPCIFQLNKHIFCTNFLDEKLSGGKILAIRWNGKVLCTKII